MSTETENLKLFKYDKEADKEELVDIDKAFNENWDKIDKAVGKNKTDIETNQTDISNLKKQDISQNELIEQLQKRNALLESQIPTGTVEGENITIKDSSNMPFKKFEISGNDYQETSEASSNILDPNRLTKGFINLETGALEGVTSTYPNSTYTPPIKLNTNDVLRIFNSPSAGQRLRIYNLDGTYNSYVNESYYTAETDCLVRVLFLDTINDNTSIKINNANSTYEEFTPNMPSIDYRSEVRACGDNVNIFSPVNLSNCSINNDGTINNLNDRICTDYIQAEGNIDIALSVEDASLFMGIAYYDSNKTYISRKVNNNLTKLIDKTPSNTNYIRAFVNYANEVMNENSIKNHKIKLEKSSTSTPYSKHGQGSMTFKKSNKNVLNLKSDDYNWSTGKAHIEGNTIKLTGGQAIGTIDRTKTKQEIYIEKGNTITYSIRIIDGVENYVNGWIMANLVFYYADGTTFYENKGRFANPSEKYKTITQTILLEKDLVGVCASIGASGVFNNGDTTTSLTIGLQLEEEVVATDYIEHESKEYIIPTQQPFYKEDDFVKEKDVVTNLGQNSGVNLINENLQAGIYYAHFRILQKPTASTTFSCYINETDTSELGMLNINNYDVGKEYVKKIEITEDSTIKYVLWGNSKNESIKFQFAINKSKTGFENNLVQIQGLDVNWNLAEGVHRYEKHNYYEKIFDGTEYFTLHTGLTTDNYLVVYMYITGMKFYPKDNLLSNYFIAKNERGSKNCIYGGYEEEFDISISKTIASTVEELKSKLAERNANGTPMKLYYPLATPLFIPCTEDQNAMLDEIEQDENYKNITHIYSEDEISPICNIEYYKDRETTEKNLEDRITALEELLSTTATSAMLLDNMQTDLESEV